MTNAFFLVRIERSGAAGEPSVTVFVCKRHPKHRFGKPSLYANLAHEGGAASTHDYGVSEHILAEPNRGGIKQLDAYAVWKPETKTLEEVANWGNGSLKPVIV